MIHALPENRLRTLRKEHGLTLEQLSQATGLNPSTLHANEAGGRDISLANALRLACFYGLSLEDVWRPLWERICDEVAPAPEHKAERFLIEPNVCNGADV
jgi:transcriptional regulator with XRE-family HTH domain